MGSCMTKLDPRDRATTIERVKELDRAILNARLPMASVDKLLKERTELRALLLVEDRATK